MPSTGDLSLSFPGIPSEVPRMRRFVSLWLGKNDVGEPMGSELLLAVTEAITNACQHPAPPGDQIRIACLRRKGFISISVSDKGHGFSVDLAAAGTQPDAEQEGGRGLFLMRRLTDQVSVKRTKSGTIVTLTRAVPPLDL